MSAYGILLNKTTTTTIPTATQRCTVRASQLPSSIQQLDVKLAVEPMALPTQVKKLEIVRPQSKVINSDDVSDSDSNEIYETASGLLNQFAELYDIKKLDWISPIFYYVAKMIATDFIVSERSQRMKMLALITVDFLREFVGIGIADLCQFVQQSFRRLREAFYSTVVRPQSSVTDVRQGYSLFKAAINSELVVTLRRFISNIMSLKIFGKDDPKQLKFGYAKKSMSTLDLMITIGDDLDTLLKLTDDLQNGVRFSDILINKDPVGMFTQTYWDLYYSRNKTYLGLKVEGYTERRAYLHKVRETIKDGQEVLRRITCTAQRGNVMRSIYELEKIEHDIAAMCAGKRITPYGICLVGTPGVGKGTVLDIVNQVLCDTIGVEYSDDIVFHRNPVDQYWSGYDVAKTIVHYTEPGARSTTIVERSGDPIPEEMLSLISDQPMAVNMPDIESKGNMFPNPYMVIADTNIEWMNFRYILNNPAAAMRRFLFVQVSVKEEYRLAGTQQLDSAKAHREGAGIDCWEFKLYRQKADGNVKVVTEELHDGFVDTQRFLQLLRMDMTKHFDQQQKTKEMKIREQIGKYTQMESLHLDCLLEVNPQSNNHLNNMTNYSYLSKPPQSLRAQQEELIACIRRHHLLWSNNIVPCLLHAVRARELRLLKVKETVRNSFLIKCLSSLRNKREIAKHQYNQFRGHLSTYPISWSDYFLIKSPDIFFDFVDYYEYRKLDAYDEHRHAQRKFWNNFAISHKNEQYMSSKVKAVKKFGRYIRMSAAKKTFDGVAYAINSRPAGLILGSATQYAGSSLFRALSSDANLKARKALTKSKAYYNGKKANFIVFTPQTNFAIICAALVAFVFLLKVFRKGAKEVEQYSDVHSQGMTASKMDGDQVINDISEISGVAKPRVTRKKMFWSDFAPTEVTSSSVQTKNSSEKVLRTIRRNMKKLTNFLNDEEYSTIHVLGLYGNNYLVNRHFLINGGEKVLIQNLDPDDLSLTGSSQIATLNYKNITELGDDLAIIQLPMACLDIRPYVTQSKEFINGTFNRNLNTIGITCSKSVDNIIMRYGHTVTVSDQHTETSYTINCWKYNWENAVVGNCGIPIIVQMPDGGFNIVGIHSAGVQGVVGFCVPICRDQLQVVTPQCFRIASLAPNLRVDENWTDFTDPHPKSIFNEKYNRKFTSLTYIGTIKGYNRRKPSPSKLFKTPFHHNGLCQDVIGVSPYKENNQPKFLPPPMTGKMVQGEWLEPFSIWADKFRDLRTSLDPQICENTIEKVTKLLISRLEKKGITNLAPVSFDVALNGAPENSYMRGMYASTSAGIVRPGKKRDYLDIVEIDGVTKYVAQEEVKQQVAEMLSAYKRGEMALPLVGGQLKDEPRSYEKAVKCKTRAFWMSSMEQTLINRMYLMPIYSLMCEMGDAFNTAIGINMHGVDAGTFIEKFLKYDKFCTGDYAGFDTSLPIDIGFMACEIQCRIAKHFGYNDEALTILSGILTDNMFPLCFLAGDVFMAPGFQPSGKYGTAEDNSFRNMLLLIYYMEYGLNSGELKEKDYIDKLECVFYGDDSVIGVSDEISYYLNNVKLQIFAKLHYGMDYTSADKSSTVKPFETFEEVSFLKRIPMFRKDLNHWVMQLDKDSIMKAICFSLPSNHVTPEVQNIESCVSAMRELFFHLEEKEYMVTREKMLYALNKIYPSQDIDTLREKFPSFAKIKISLYGDE